MRACELESPVAIKADKYDMPAARNWQNYSGEADSVKIYTRVELLVRFFLSDICRPLCDIVAQIGAG